MCIIYIYMCVCVCVCGTRCVYLGVGVCAYVYMHVRGALMSTWNVQKESPCGRLATSKADEFDPDVPVASRGKSDTDFGSPSLAARTLGQVLICAVVAQHQRYQGETAVLAKDGKLRVHSDIVVNRCCFGR